MPALNLKASAMLRHTGTTNETMVFPGRCILLAIIPEATTTGTVTIRDTPTASAGPVDHLAAIGLAQDGKQFGPFGVECAQGISVQLSVAGDAVGVIFAPVA